MSSKKTVTAEIATDTDLWREFEEFENDYNSRAEALRAGLRRGILSKEGGGPVERVVFLMTTISVLMSVWLFFLTFLAAFAVAVADFIQVSPLVVGGVFAMVTLSLVATSLVGFLLRRYGIARRADRWFAERRRGETA